MKILENVYEILNGHRMMYGMELWCSDGGWKEIESISLDIL
jgi:hypothetical protein